MFIDFLTYLGTLYITAFLVVCAAIFCAAIKLEEIKERRESRKRYAEPFEWITLDEEDVDPHVSNLKYINGRN